VDGADPARTGSTQASHPTRQMVNVERLDTEKVTDRE